MSQNNSRSNPRKDKRSKKKSPSAFDAFTFVNIRLSTEDKEFLSTVEFDGNEMMLFISELIDNGYKFSLSPDKEHESFIASVTGKTCISENVNRVLTARGATPENALLALRYKLQHYCLDGIFPDDQAGNGKPLFG